MAPHPTADAQHASYLRKLQCPPVPGLTHARVLTMDPDQPEAQAIFWEDTIRAIGTNEEIAALGDTVDARTLGDPLVIPGFVDGHMHFLHVGVRRTRPDLSHARNLDEALATMRAFVARTEGSVTGEGWDEAHWPDRRPQRADLDAISEDRPLVMRRMCGHVSIANTAALDVVRQHWDDPEKVDLDTGVLLEEPSLFLNEVLPEPPERLATALAKATGVAHRLGITSIGTYEQTPMRNAIEAAAQEGSLGIRVACHIYPQALDQAIASGFRTGTPRGALYQDGGMKVFLDGSLGGHSAYLREPYTDKPTRGIRNFTDEQLDDLFERAHTAGIQIHAHVIGDGAVDQGLDAFERLASRHRNFAELRHRFEHYEIVHDDQIERTAQLGIHCCAQPNFVGVWSADGGMYEDRLGDRFRVNNRFNTFQAQGVDLSFGSDGMPFGPLYGLSSAVNHPMPSERPSIERALALYTREAARGLHLEAGMLRVGMPADLLVIDDWQKDGQWQDPRMWIVRRTIQGGRIVHEGTESFPADEH